MAIAGQDAIAIIALFFTTQIAHNIFYSQVFVIDIAVLWNLPAIPPSHIEECDPRHPEPKPRSIASGLHISAGQSG